GNRTFLRMRDAQAAAECQQKRENSRYLPGHPLVAGLEITADLAGSVAISDLVFVSIPSHSFRAISREIKPLLQPHTIVVSTDKGIEPDSFTLMRQILETELLGQPIGVLSGPNVAKEIVRQLQSGTVIASENDQVIQRVQETLRSESFRVYANHDRYGVELGGALKNIYAIMCGMAAALGAGQNTQAMLLTRSLAEMGRFAKVMGANPMTFLGLAGVGDLI